MRHNLEFLDVDLNTNCLAFPTSLLNSNVLRELKVVQRRGNEVKIRVADKNCAPKLTSLSLHSVVFINRDRNSCRVLLEFLVLERLEFMGTTFGYWKWKNVKFVEIYAPSLTSFSFQPAISLFRFEDCDYAIKIVAPRLSRLSCFGGLPRNLTLDGTSIVSALMSGRYETMTSGTEAADLLNGLTNVEELTLSSSFDEVLRNGPPLHCHDKLRRLTLQGTSVEQLLKWLHAMPSLEFLSVTVEFWQDDDYKQVEIVPFCIASHLEEVVFHVEDGIRLMFLNGEPVYGLARFLLKEAKVLKKLTITTREHIDFCEHLEEVLSKVFHCSPSVEICYSVLPPFRAKFNTLIWAHELRK